MSNFLCSSCLNDHLVQFNIIGSFSGCSVNLWYLKMALNISHKGKLAISKSQKQKVKKTPQKKDINSKYNVIAFLSKRTNEMTKQLKNN